MGRGSLACKIHRQFNRSSKETSMVPLTALWLPILLSAVIVFVASSVMHMLLPYHHGDYRQLPDEDNVRAALRAVGLTRGLYIFPFCSHKDMKSPAMQEKYKEGPVGH